MPLKKALEFQNIIKVVRSAFHGDNKHYPQCFLDNCLYNLAAMSANRFAK